MHTNYKNMGVNKLINDNIITTLNYLSNVELTINIPLYKTICDLFNNKDSRVHKLIYTKLHPDTPNLFRLKSGGLKYKPEITKILEYNSKYYKDFSVLYITLSKIFSLFLPPDTLFLLILEEDFIILLEITQSGELTISL